MKLKFTKMQGVGNDFVVLDGVTQSVPLTPALAQKMADRHFGIGCDQILLVEKPDPAGSALGADFRYRIWNADGGEVEQCGNGARCFARFVRDHGLTDKDEIRVKTLSGLITPRLESDGQVTVDMGAPIFEPARIPFSADVAAIVHALDVDAAWLDAGGRAAWEAAGVADRIRFKEGPAAESLRAMLDAGEEGRFDFAFVDADKGGYDEYYEACLRLLKSGGILAVDNVLWSGLAAFPKPGDEDSLAINRLNTKIRVDPRVAPWGEN